MKSLTEYMNESINEAKWQSGNGSFNADHAESLAKAWKISLKQAYKALDAFDDQFGGPAEWDNKEKFIFKNPDSKLTWKYDMDDETWTPEK